MRQEMGSRKDVILKEDLLPSDKFIKIYPEHRVTNLRLFLRLIMKRDMELIRKILFAIEEQYVDVDIYNLHIDGYDFKAIAYHCSILNDAGLISDYDDRYGGNGLSDFGLGSLTWEGHEFLDKVRSDTIWNKTKEAISKKGLPMILDEVKEVASTIISSMTEGALNALK